MIIMIMKKKEKKNLNKHSTDTGVRIQKLNAWLCLSFNSLQSQSQNQYTTISWKLQCMSEVESTWE